MNKIFKCIDEYMIDLERDIMSIVEDQSVPMTEKNRLMEPIVDQKKVLLNTKKLLRDIKTKNYEAKCGMSEKVNNGL